MDEQEKLRLKKIYQEMPDKELLKLLSVDKREYKKGIYELVLEEVKKRGLEAEVTEIEKSKTEEPKQISLELLLLNALYEVEAVLNILEKKGILTKQEVLEEIKRIEEYVKNCTPEEARQIMRDAGIVNPDGTLTDRYK